MIGGPPKDVENSEHRLDTSFGLYWQNCALYISLKMYTCEHKKLFFWQSVLLGGVPDVQPLYDHLYLKLKI